jgi:hypothetical protein
VQSEAAFPSGILVVMKKVRMRIKNNNFFISAPPWQEIPDVNEPRGVY